MKSVKILVIAVLVVVSSFLSSGIVNERVFAEAAARISIASLAGTWKSDSSSSSGTYTDNNPPYSVYNLKLHQDYTGTISFDNIAPDDSEARIKLSHAASYDWDVYQSGSFIGTAVLTDVIDGSIVRRTGDNTFDIYVDQTWTIHVTASSENNIEFNEVGTYYLDQINNGHVDATYSLSRTSGGDGGGGSGGGGGCDAGAGIGLLALLAGMVLLKKKR